MNDRFARSPSSFGRTFAPITPNDDADIDGAPAKAVTVTAAGTLAVIPADNADDEVLVYAEDLPVGFTPPFQIRRVKATGTTATVVAVGW